MRSTVLITVDERVICHDLGPLKVKIEAHFASTHGDKGVAHSLLMLRRTKDEKESAASRAGDLSTQSAVLQGSFIHIVDSIVGDFRRQPFLDFPALVEQ